MAGAHGSGGEYKDLVVFLAAAGVVVPLLSRWKISPVLGFLAAGVLLGPDGLGRFADVLPWLAVLTISDAEQLAQLSELGVAFLLFMIGLELSWDRLRAMRRLVFGLGMSQIALCASVLAGVFMLMGQPLASAAVLGLGLSLSSTAVVLPVMAERNRMRGAVGRATFATLLAQDLAVAPILVTVTVLAALATTSGDLDPAAIGRALLTLAPAAGAVALLVVVGRLGLRPLFRSVAKSRSGGGGGRQELFVALCLLIVVGAGVAAEAAGLSMSLGALIAGLLLAETEYRREIELNIEPFKGLLLGVFFVGVGIGLDLDAVVADPVGVFGLALGLTAVKAVLIFGLARLWGLSLRSAVETALVLGPAGEFAFVILNTGLVEGIADPGFTQGVLVSATISMFTVPLMALLGQKLAGAAPTAPVLVPTGSEHRTGDVLIVGFGRVGRLVAEMLTEHGQSFIAVDSDASTVAAARRDGYDVSYGDAARSEMLRLCGIEGTRAVVVTMDAPGKVDEVVIATRALRQDLPVIARARDDRHAARLYALGVTDAVPETTEASLQLAENTLVDLGIPMGLVLASIHERRDRFRAVFQAATPEHRRDKPTRALRARLQP
jgi:CPA2 family monovalent cation:H+ antiporter-2